MEKRLYFSILLFLASFLLSCEKVDSYFVQLTSSEINELISISEKLTKEKFSDIQNEEVWVATLSLEPSFSIYKHKLDKLFPDKYTRYELIGENDTINFYFWVYREVYIYTNNGQFLENSFSSEKVTSGKNYIILKADS